MLKKMLITAAVAAGLSFTVANVSAQNIGVQSGANVNANAGASTHARGTTTRSHTGIHARAQVQGPNSTPPGWHHGRKTGWHCGSPPRAGCKPPGLR
jgi:hypothetical protein